MNNPSFFIIIIGAAQDLGVYLVLVTQRRIHDLEMGGIANRYGNVPWTTTVTFLAC